METTPVCPVCGKTVIPGAPQGLCPECLMKSGFETKAGNEPAHGKRAFVPPPVQEIAKLFPQLEIVELLGQGGMGAVYKARQPRLNRFVALKILSPERQKDPSPNPPPVRFGLKQFIFSPFCVQMDDDKS